MTNSEKLNVNDILRDIIGERPHLNDGISLNIECPNRSHFKQHFGDNLSVSNTATSEQPEEMVLNLLFTYMSSGMSSND